MKNQSSKGQNSWSWGILIYKGEKRAVNNTGREAWGPEGRVPKEGIKEPSS